jgi:hypothetical protein
MSARHLLAIAVPMLALVLGLATGVSSAAAEEATWRLEQPAPPPPPPGVPALTVPVALGRIGDIEFWEPPGSAPQANRGLLITHGNGEAVPPGVWAYDGTGWHEIATVCGATNGRIAWGGPADFWTVSDQRPGQAPSDGQQPPLEDDSLCHFSNGSVVASYAHLAFEEGSYEQIFGAACLPPEPPRKSSEDCWFGGEKLPAPRVGSFHLHWNGTTLEEQPYPNQGDPVKDMRALENAIFESVAYSQLNLHNEEGSSSRPPVLHFAEAETEMQPLEEELPLYASSTEPTEALEYLRLGAAEGVLWAAAGRHPGSVGEGAQVTVMRRIAGVWTQVIGPEAHPLPDLFESSQEEAELLGGAAKNAEVRAIAPEPGSEDAWLALAKPRDLEREAAAGAAVLVHVSAQGAVLGVQTLPSAAERALPSDDTGIVQRLVCPALEDCWMANVNGWLYHLASEEERTLPKSELPGFPAGKIVSERPHDAGIAQEVSDAPPPDTSGLQEEAPDYGGTFAESKAPVIEAKFAVALLSDLHSRLIHKTTLELRFRLAVRARIRLLAKRRNKVVASTPMRTLAAGNRKLLLRLNPKEWPTKLSFETHALAPLPTTTTKETQGGPEHSGKGANSESTELVALPRLPSFGGLGTLP